MSVPHGCSQVPVVCSDEPNQVARDVKDRERRVMEYATANPIRRVGLSAIDTWYTVYETLHFSGICAVVAAWWWGYPTFCRWRHHNIARYRKEQITMRRRFFSSNIPKYQNLSERRHIPFIFVCLSVYRWFNTFMVMPQLHG
eukprot:Tbor_TRINITY_DN5417_c3_g9::TRINITY_DN5417_c3_g9_i1::g.24994::m.24994